MIAFLDTSAIVPLLIDEPGTSVCLRVWEAADVLLCTQLAYVEAAAALSRATRLGRMTTGQRDTSLAQLTDLWQQLQVATGVEHLALRDDHGEGGPMPSLHLPDVPDGVIQWLERIAAAEHASVSAVAVRALDAASRRAHNSLLLAALPDTGITTVDIVDALDARHTDH